MKQLILSTVFILLLCSSVFAVTAELVTTDPAPAQAGEYADITLQFSQANEADEIRNVTIYIEPTNFIDPISQPETFSVIRAGSTITRTFRVFFSEDLPEGRVDIPVIIQQPRRSQEALLEVFVQQGDTKPDLRIGEIKTVPTELLADTEDNEVRIILQNLGDRDAELVSATLIPQSDLVKPSYSYSLEDSVSQIQGGDEQTLVFTIDLEPTREVTFDAILNLTYRAQRTNGGSYETYMQQLPTRIELVEAPLLEVSQMEQLTDFSVGTTENDIRITVRNTGDADAEDVRVRLVPDISYPFIFEELTQYVGAEIASQQSANVVFTLEVLDSADIRDYPIKVRLESLVGDTRYVREDVISITTSEGRSYSTVQIGGFAIGAIIVIALLFAFFRKRK